MAIDNGNQKGTNVPENDSEIKFRVTFNLGIQSKPMSKDEFISKIFKKITNKKVDNLNKYEEYNRSKKGIYKITTFTRTIINNYWIQYQCDKSPNKVTNLYNYAINFLPKKIFRMLKTDIALDNLLGNLHTFLNESHDNLEIVTYLKDFQTLSSKINNHVTRFQPTNQQIIDSLRKFGSNWVEDTFAHIDKTLSKEMNLHLAVIGKLGTGKSTIISVIEGYLSNINNTPPSERRISANGRGTTEITTTNIKLGNINIAFDDTIGQGDPGKGYSQKELWAKIREHYEEACQDGISGVDTILYSLDASIPRLDKTDFDTLEHFFIEFKDRYPDSLDWWKRIAIVLTKVNLIKLKKYDKSGGLPKYESKKWLAENGLRMNMTNLMKYNEVYKEMVIPAMKEWKEAVEERIYQKVYNDTLSYEEKGQSFIVYFNHLAKKYYPNLTDEQIYDYGKSISTIAIGEASQKSNVDNSWDYQSCEIKSIPNFKDALCDMFDIESIEDEINEYTYSKNWFSEIMNKIYSTTESDNFRLTMLKLNEQSKFDEYQNSNAEVAVESTSLVSSSSVKEIDLKDVGLLTEKNVNITLNAESTSKTEETFERSTKDTIFDSISNGAKKILNIIAYIPRKIYGWFFGG